ncbi:hypothetical protein ACJX0J_028926, partial [Zea mays]
MERVLVVEWGQRQWANYHRYFFISLVFFFLRSTKFPLEKASLKGQHTKDTQIVADQFDLHLRLKKGRVGRKAIPIDLEVFEKRGLNGLEMDNAFFMVKLDVFLLGNAITGRVRGDMNARTIQELVPAVQEAFM